MRRFAIKFFFERNGWTDSQYSIFRVCFGIYLLHISLTVFSTAGIALGICGAALSLLLIMRIADGLAALGLAALCALFFGILPKVPHHSQFLLVYILLAHLELPGKTPLEEQWSMPQPVHALIWLIAILFYTVFGAACVLGIDYPTVTYLFLLSPLAVFEKFRPRIWLVLSIVVLYLLAALDDVAVPLMFVQFFLFDPFWIKPAAAKRAETIFYDGDCGLCHRVIIFTLQEDRSDGRFNFSPLDSPYFLDRSKGKLPAEPPDSIVLETDKDELLFQSDAIAGILAGLGGLWRVSAMLLLLLPKGFRDWGYAIVAKYRKHVFASPELVCPIVPEKWQKRFIVDSI